MTPDDYTLEEKMLDVGDGHRLYTQLWGSKDAAETFVFLHGGPGAGCSDKHKLLFNPLKHRVIFFDQRGSGNSLPVGSLEANTTDNLVEDINRVTKYYKVDKFTITGGSWGSCLALVYAIRYPKRVVRMVLRGIFTARQSEIDFLEQGQFRAFFPDVWDAFVQSVPKAFQDNPSKYHRQRLLGKDVGAAKRSAFAFLQLESSVMGLDDRRGLALDYETFDPAGITIEFYYTANKCFLPEAYIFDNADKLTMPVSLVQGRYDAVCAPVTAWELSRLLPDGQLFWTTAGHSGNDRANWDMMKALLAA